MIDSEKVDISFDYSEDTKFDIEALDIEWMNHPRKYEKWSKILTIMLDKVKTETDAFDRLYAKLDLEYRDKLSGTKTTEAIIKNNVILDEKYIEAQKKLNKLVYDMNMVKNVLNSVDRVKPALENEVKLWAGAYFAGPKEPRDLKKILNMQEQWREKVRDNNIMVSDRINSRRRKPFKEGEEAL